jgi:hypothetical protein
MFQRDSEICTDTPSKHIRVMTHGQIFAESVHSCIASDGIKQTQQGTPIGGIFADSAFRLLAVQRAV